MINYVDNNRAKHGGHNNPANKRNKKRKNRIVFSIPKPTSNSITNILKN